MLLGSPKSEMDRQLGKPVFAPNLLGIPGEKTYGYSLGAFEIQVGFVNDIARTMAVVRRQGPNTALTPAERSSALALNAPAASWTSETAPPAKVPASKSKTASKKGLTKPPTTYFSHSPRDPKTKEILTPELFGWAPGDKPFAFFHLPVLENQPPILPDEWSIRQRLG